MSAEPSSSIRAAESVVVSVAPSKNGRTPGKAHKSAKTALRRSYISPSVKTPFEKRMEKEKAQQAAKQLERELKEEKETDRQRKVNIIKERRARKEEKQREEELRAKMSAKKLQRMKKREGRSKKING
ncbi:rRNA-processing protein CGR1 [Cryptococcus neoformans C23]|uniref:rRNA-processing protein n=2 Tax=Cryptococcus neoformans TaxID=5207 RepID=A0A854QDT3_CRYNE|nr:rRNA-processing protein CGR1 [Cryptococcus neoformans var. grubii H99]AUB25225.1 rRNA-processing protein CGR1 [Cryptococcus neoformans var. grubii]OWZ31492.1 rRNA-processing protein CGR1 [Cryptococcus neoformans var. grubii AD2-60a]OWZ42622.1 rRNA-processing protein CGR1 [Cryptococcus neoformans var. grubii AD1-83a]OWZ43653.1 rRNA-processing protein CGR1 [Cryptococcus neoformans var. grubii C23]OWZ54337.1 rRNA-processing protein CGR1 [Cryptococcus neoformans var. grubii 125.91]OXC84309.1 r|eukprot:XP_012050129.1 rRNA-processing protein CGR1 [Cryptococcus neoformans var. grubii H99]